MSIGKLSNLITQGIINQFKSASGGSGISSGGFLGGSGASSNIKNALQVGQRAYTNSVENLGDALSSLNLSEDSLEKLGGIVDEMIVVVGKATQDNLTNQTRARLDRQFRDLVKDFYDTTEDAEVNGFDLLSTEGISQLLQKVGLDVETGGDGTSTINSDFQLLGGNQYWDKIFDSDRKLTSRADAFFLLEDLKALKEQIEANIDVVGELKMIVDGNITVARAAAESFLARQNSIRDGEQAASIARKISQDILRNAREAVEFVHDLESIGVANLLGSDALDD